MIVCRKCGGQNEEGAEFCGSCGAFLEWSGKKVGEKRVVDLAAAETEAEGSQTISTPTAESESVVAEGSSAGTTPDKTVTIEAAPETAPPDLVIVEQTDVIEVSETTKITPESERVKKTPTKKAETKLKAVTKPAAEGSNAGESLKSAAPEDRLDVASRSKESTDAAPVPPKSTPDEVVVEKTEKERRAASLVATPVRPSRPARRRPKDQPKERKPEPVKTRVVTTSPTVAPVREIKPGDLICGQCGEGNDPVRKFCRKCGSSLLEAKIAPPPPIPFWKRLLGRRRGTLQAGERPGRRAGPSSEGGVSVGRSVRLISAIVIALLIAGGVAIAGIIGIPKLIDFVQGISTERQNVYPASVRASSQKGSHRAELLVDKKTNTYWAEAAEGTGENQVLVFKFNEPFHLTAIGFHIQGQGTNEPRPASVLISFYDRSGKFISDDTQLLKDTDKFQTVKVNARDVAQVNITIRSVHPSVNGRGTTTSISEVEFFTPS